MEISDINVFLEGAYDVLNDRFFSGELPRVKITIQSSPRTYGHFTPWNAWSDGETGYPDKGRICEASSTGGCAKSLHGDTEPVKSLRTKAEGTGAER